jgi:hypothetical protein
MPENQFQHPQFPGSHVLHENLLGSFAEYILKSSKRKMCIDPGEYFGIMMRFGILI